MHKIESTNDGKQKLVIEQATTDDIGQYRVEAVSTVGKTSTEAKLDVKGELVSESPIHTHQLMQFAL